MVAFISLPMPIRVMVRLLFITGWRPNERAAFASNKDYILTRTPAWLRDAIPSDLLHGGVYGCPVGK